MLGILIVDNLFDLPNPVDQSGFQTLDQVFVIHGLVHIGVVLIRDVELGEAFLGIGLFCEGGHETVELSHELFLGIVGPALVSDEMEDISIVHLIQ